MTAFGYAFKAARAAGKTTFKFQGKSYHTKTKDEMAKTKKAVPTPTPRPDTNTTASVPTPTKPNANGAASSSAAAATGTTSPGFGPGSRAAGVDAERQVRGYSTSRAWSGYVSKDDDRFQEKKRTFPGRVPPRAENPERPLPGRLSSRRGSLRIG